jgi:tRNA nucleotidyltransferase (CCA-adding enzyme)
METLTQAGEAAISLGYRAYAVGGFVRDLLLKRPNLDIDMVVEGDGLRLAKELAGRWHCSYKCFPKFCTAALYLSREIKVDVASARRESYSRPAALPTVEKGASIRYDLLRRDFSINSLALDLSPRSFGELVDFFDAAADLDHGLIRVLHDQSIVDDPTRAFRAVRFSQRFGFVISPDTKRLIQEAVEEKLFDRLSGKRLFSELKLLLAEESPAKAIHLLARLSLLPTLHPKLRLTRASGLVISRVDNVLSQVSPRGFSETYYPWLVYLLALFDPLTEEELTQVRARMAIGGRREREALDKRDLAMARLGELEGLVRPANSQIYSCLHELPTELLLYLMARSNRASARSRALHFLVELRRVKPLITGRQLVSLGLAPGPLYGDILAELHTAKLDGRLATKEDEIRFVKERWLKDKR